MIESSTLLKELVIHYFQATPVKKLPLLSSEAVPLVTNYQSLQEQIIDKLLEPSTNVCLSWDFDQCSGDKTNEEIYEDLEKFHGKALLTILPSPHYQQTFLKHLIAKLEENNEEVHEYILSLYMRHLSNEFKNYSNRLEELGLSDIIHKKYFLSDDLKDERSVILTESKAMILSGTTGLRTWQASLMLGQYLLDNPGLLSGKNVLELGSGVGFLGVLASRLNPSSITLTDFNYTVLQRLALNVNLNAPKHLNDLIIQETQIKRWDWSNITDEMIIDANSNLILGADVTYDPAGIDLLVALLARLFAQSKHPDHSCRALIACTVRNIDTFTHFLRSLDKLPNLSYYILELSGDPSVSAISEERIPRKFYYEDTISIVKLVCIENKL